MPEIGQRPNILIINYSITGIPKLNCSLLKKLEYRKDEGCSKALSTKKKA